MDVDPKTVLRRYFDVAHEAVLWKIDGLSEYDLRRPMTPTGTNLLGMVKHLAFVELGYFGLVFDRTDGLAMPEHSDEPNADMYATADESRDEIIDRFRQAWAHAQTTIDELELDAEGHVPWWGENNPVTLQLILVHMTTEIHRHLGQMDIMRETIDGAVGLRDGNTNLPTADEFDWSSYRDRLQRIADGFSGSA